MLDVVSLLVDIVAFVALTAALSVVALVTVCLALVTLSGVARWTSPWFFWLVFLLSVLSAAIAIGSGVVPGEVPTFPRTTTTYPSDYPTTSTTLFPCDEQAFDLPGLANPCRRTWL
ncbi:MAG: hypothetical protein L0206_20265 [Actinobacteria bacterium]|nr:hypothetical protein [Actinomycetota bacterium]